MLKRVVRLGALIVFGALLVFAPRLFIATGAPYRTGTQERALLRIALCLEDAGAVSSLYRALDGFRTEHPGVHLRVTRADEAQLASLAEPLPDVYLYPPGAQLSAGLFAPLDTRKDAPPVYAQPVARISDGLLICSVGAHASEEALGRALAAFLAAPGETPAGK